MTRRAALSADKGFWAVMLVGMFFLISAAIWPHSINDARVAGRFPLNRINWSGFVPALVCGEDADNADAEGTA